MASGARDAFYTLSVSSGETRNLVLKYLSDLLQENRDGIFAANREDLAEAEASGLAAPLLSRLKLDREKLDHVCDGLRSLAGLKDPLGETVFCHEITEGLKLYRVTCPIGVIGIIFESRPDALIQISTFIFLAKSLRRSRSALVAFWKL